MVENVHLATSRRKLTELNRRRSRWWASLSLTIFSIDVLLDEPNRTIARPLIYKVDRKWPKILLLGDRYTFAKERSHWSTDSSIVHVRANFSARCDGPQVGYEKDASFIFFTRSHYTIPKQALLYSFRLSAMPQSFFIGSRNLSWSLDFVKPNLSLTRFVNLPWS